MKRKAAVTPLGNTPKIPFGDEAVVRRAMLEGRANELYLFHGTTPHIVPLVVHGGFDERVSSIRGLFGGGIYFAMNASKSDQYCTPDGDGLYSIFLSRVTVGEAFRTSVSRAGERRPPAGADSVVGQTAPDKYVEFVSYDRRMTLPEYLLQYRRTWVDPAAVGAAAAAP